MRYRIDWLRPDTKAAGSIVATHLPRALTIARSMSEQDKYSINVIRCHRHETHPMAVLVNGHRYMRSAGICDPMIDEEEREQSDAN